MKTNLVCIKYIFVHKVAVIKHTLDISLDLMAAILLPHYCNVSGLVAAQDCDPEQRFVGLSLVSML